MGKHSVYKGLENPGVWVSLRVSETITPQIPRYNCFFFQVLNLFISFYFLYVGVLLHVCMLPPECLMPMEVRRGG